MPLFLSILNEYFYTTLKLIHYYMLTDNSMLMDNTMLMDISIMHSIYFLFTTAYASNFFSYFFLFLFYS